MPLPSLLLMVDRPENFVPQSNEQERIQQRLADELYKSLWDNETLYDLFNYLSPSCEDMIAGCYVYATFYNSTACCSEVFSDDYAVYHQGRCVSSRFSRLFLAVNQTQPGDYSGLSVILQEDQETFDAELDLRLSMVPVQEGNRVVLNPWYEPPHEALAAKSYIADVGSVSRLAITITSVDSSGLYTWPWANRECLKIRRQVLSGGAGSNDCRIRKIRAAFSMSYGCMPLGMLDSPGVERLGEVPLCTPERMLEIGQNWTAIPMLGDGCPDLCQEIILEASMDTTPFKRRVLEHSSRLFGTLAATSDRNLTFSVVIVYYPNLTMRKIVLSRSTFKEWLSAFGGQLSLFLGASVITILEMGSFCVRFMVMTVKRVVKTVCPARVEEKRKLVEKQGWKGPDKMEGMRKRVTILAKVEPVIP